MKPLSLHLSGFTGIRSGLGRETLDLDLSDRKGLVAIVGPNGTGKTTILDSLHPYRLMPFRSSGYSEKSFSYYEEVTGDARKELVWSHEGQTYRSDIRIKMGGKVNKTEATLYVQTADGWAPARAPDGTPSDGKTNTYDACVHAICGSPEMFFSAAFSAQNRRSLCDYNAGEMKLLLSELLGLDRYLELSRQAADAAKHVAASAAGLTGRLQQLDADVAALDSKRAMIDVVTADRDQRQTDRSKARQAVTDASARLAEVTAAEANAATHRARRAELTADRASTVARHGERLTELAQSERDAQRETDATDLRNTLVGAIRRQQAAKDAIAAGMAAATFGLSKDDAFAAVTAAEQAVQAAIQVEADHASVHDTVKTAVTEIGGIKSTLASIQREAETLKKQQAAAKNRAGLMSTVPCAGMEMAAGCALLKDARTSSGEATELETKIAKLRTDYQTTAEKQIALETVAAKINSARAAHEAATRDLQTARTALKAAQDDYTKAIQAEHAKGRLAEAEASLEAETATMQELNDKLTEREAEGRARLATIVAKRAAEVSEHATRLASIDAAIAAIPDPGNPDELRQAQQAVATAEAHEAAMDQAVAASVQRLATLQAEYAALQQRVDEGETIRQQAIDAAEDEGQWRLLARALGKDGIVALAIDDAGPAISTIANDLLAACYGPRFAVRFDTQSEKADGSLKEDFDIRVFDSERDDDKSLSKMSGGERLWLNEAITRAIALHRARATGAAYECYFSDESDGALDEARKEMFGRMKRRVLEIGGADTEYYITHTASLWDMADSLLDTGALRA